ncbi:uncharacterized protein LOC132390574 isoform X3 [Hypanus sabinus]|uniref:uncharacterized protein LOC132390574 isoform X3 n=1 Tax=Hypanus sabinus TaxID=79690 RepID=UPI0028C37A25|nr:uncharacterized protein LOC132390574 isoform X3 [Hypanus sabinus]
MWKSEVRRCSEETDGGRMTTDNSTCHPSIYRGSGQVHTQYSKSTLRVTMLPEFLLVASLASMQGLSKDHCLGYDVLCTTADYEFRRYNESVWVGAYVSRDFFDRTDSYPLYHYFKWQNSEEMEIQLTGQVLLSFTGHGPSAVYLMLPEELWDNPPTATDPRVFVTRLPMMDVFARKIRPLRVSDEVSGLPWFVARSGDMVRCHRRIRLPGPVSSRRTLWILRLLPVKRRFLHALHCLFTPNTATQ